MPPYNSPSHNQEGEEEVYLPEDESVDIVEDPSDEGNFPSLTNWPMY